MIAQKISYPLKFDPILKEKVWGGNKLITRFNKKSSKENIGESWEISDVDGDESVISNGVLTGQTLPEVLEIYKEQLVGNHVYEHFKNKFPLLIKFIDAKKPLSIQVHPNDQLAQERHNSFGKTEMWYIMDAEEDGNLIVGFKKDSNISEYLEHLENKTLMQILNEDKVAFGDVYFIPTGRVHAIGAGVMLAEIQQTSDITYRIYDWDRPDKEGNFRELHTDLALDAIDYTAQQTYKSEYVTADNKPTELVSCEYFTTNELIVNNTYVAKNDKDSFVIYMCVSGSCSIQYNNGLEENLEKGQTVLIPAVLKNYSIHTRNEAKLLEVYIK
ncbi:type I phosphomannose isomerase catalytic subunit [Aquimarina sp. AU474]|uniref:type I phosphomannose isomerase catalytic subunit n=1 Tax=Aquimarina sp. AU474 TaxID=2108529 RepID=UPI000D69C951|nr:type I phosphomannose isomerase catalytic subunit [Aquimarina sp. AU474]